MSAGERRRKAPEEAAMAGLGSRKQELARRLRVSERVLEQYLDLKRAEVSGDSDESQSTVTPELLQAASRRRAAKERPAQSR